MAAPLRIQPLHRCSAKPHVALVFSGSCRGRYSTGLHIRTHHVARAAKADEAAKDDKHSEHAEPCDAPEPTMIVKGLSTWFHKAKTKVTSSSDQEQLGIHDTPEASTKYLVRRFSTEILLVAGGALAMYRLLIELATRASTDFQLRVSQLDAENQRAPVPPSLLGAISMPLVVMRQPTWLFLAVLIASHAVRHSASIVDDWVHLFEPRLPQYADWMIHHVCRSLGRINHFMDTVLIASLQVYGCMVFLAFKDAAVENLPRLISSAKSTSETDGMLQQESIRLVKSLSSVLGGVAIIATFLSILQLAGLNLQPLLAVGGAGSIVLGLASQQVMSNFASGITFFFERPFVPGEHITLSSGIRGVVDSIKMIRTVIVTDDGVQVSIPNKILADQIIYNRSVTSPTQKAGPSTSLLMSAAGQLRFQIKLPKAAQNELGSMAKDIEEVLHHAMPGFPPRSKVRLDVISFQEQGLTIAAKAVLDPKLSASAKPEQVQAALIKISNALLKYGAAIVTT